MDAIFRAQNIVVAASSEGAGMRSVTGQGAAAVILRDEEPHGNIRVLVVVSEAFIVATQRNNLSFLSESSVRVNLINNYNKSSSSQAIKGVLVVTTITNENDIISRGRLAS